MTGTNSIKPMDVASRIVMRFRPLDLGVSTVWHVVEGRNAWHSTWSQTYFPRQFGLSIDELKDACEGFRTQGSVFSICAAPIVVMKDEMRILGLTPVNEKPARTYSALLEKMDRSHPLSALRYYDSNWLRVFEIPGKAKLLRGYRPKDFGSRSYGGAYRLAWGEKPSRDYSAFRRFYKNFRKLMTQSISPD